ncbi:VIT1/CCC1 transporter family protein [Spirochaeta isovalerica]|uniref:VIT1/CCC1 family predicted Fe2+/Mn2+ transporter n=1 Tax=Spirochaeta isovalerica TaxID=150 RepID=A0A841RED1_9SPIO|nr:VIT1/CCC1 transporter family protein [Spirochaeta isovalerica]MBB6481199.1 VIT1/CCC1 family predicted Fe2+/Mn2+ transporter [Spirochaeta isovalerica]
MEGKLEKIILREQQNEINAYYIYGKLAEGLDDAHNKAILEKISNDEYKHYKYFNKRTGVELRPNKLFVGFTIFICKIFGLTFGLKLLEKAEQRGQDAYGEILDDIPEIRTFMEDEERHEMELLQMINEERLEYVGSVVLGLNDALVELTGALAGYTFAFGNSKIIALTGLITGISASFSMAASEYLSSMHNGEENALKSSVYTGISYIFTVAFLTAPYFLFANPFFSLVVTLSIAVLIILIFNYYISVAKDTPFVKRFLEMTLISLGVSAISFGVGILVKNVFGLEI